MSAGRAASASRLRLASGLLLAFIYVPIGIIVAVLVQCRARRDLAASGVHARLVRRGARRRRASARRSLASIAGGASGRRSSRSSSARWSRSRSQRYRFFGRETISFVVVLPLALPGIVTGIALNTAFARSASSSGFLTIIVGHATFCIVVIYNNVIARLRRTSRSHRGGIGRPGRRHVRDVPPRDLPGRPDGADRRGAAGLRAVLRRDHRHELHVRRRHPDAADLDLQQLPAAQPGARW